MGVEQDVTGGEFLRPAVTYEAIALPAGGVPFRPGISVSGEM
jgi:hypothetical protein